MIKKHLLHLMLVALGCLTLLLSACNEEAKREAKDPEQPSADLAWLALLPDGWPPALQPLPGTTLKVANTHQVTGATAYHAEYVLETSPDLKGIAAHYEKCAADFGLKQGTAGLSPHGYSAGFFSDSVDLRVSAIPLEGQPLTIKVDYTPLPPMDDRTTRTIWDGLDDVPPGFPSGVLSRYPGAEIITAQLDEFGNADLIQYSDEAPDKVLEYYATAFNTRGFTDATVAGKFTGDVKLYSDGKDSVLLQANRQQDEQGVEHTVIALRIVAGVTAEQLMEDIDKQTQPAGPEEPGVPDTVIP